MPTLLSNSFFFSNEERREIINQFRTQREAAKEYKQTYERCYRQIEVNNKKNNFSLNLSLFIFSSM